MSGSPWRILGGIARPHVGVLAGFGAVLAVATGVSLAGSLLLARFVRLAIDAAPTRTLVWHALAFAACGLAASALSIVVTWRGTEAAWRITDELRIDLADHVLRADLSFHRDRTPGELVTRVDADVTSMNQFLATVVAQIIAIVVLAIGTVVVAAIVEPILAGPMVAVFAAVAAVGWRVRNRSVEQTIAERAVEAEMMGAAEQFLAAADDVASLGAGRFGTARIADHAAKLVDASALRTREQMVLQGSIRGAAALAQVAMIAVGALLFSAGHTDVAGVVLGFRLVTTVSDKVDHLTWRLNEAQGASGAASRVAALLADRRRVSSGSAALPAGPLGVRFEAVSLVYDDDDGTNAALVDIDLDLRPGRLLGVVGRTGSGKTSLARLLLSLHAPTTGRVVLVPASGGHTHAGPNGTGPDRATRDHSDRDHAGASSAAQDHAAPTYAGPNYVDLTHAGASSAAQDHAAPTHAGPAEAPIDLQMIDEGELRRRITAVPQDVQLFPGTVADNVTLFAPRDEHVVMEALHAVGLGPWLASLPNGLATELASDHRDGAGARTGVSSGEAQLLALSRALLRDPAIVVLDEATSRIDPATQAATAHAIRTLVEGRTGIVIAHRLETLDVCDDIAVLDRGRVVEHGPREVLAANPDSRYARVRMIGESAEELV